MPTCSERRYKRWEWNAGESPPFEVRRRERFEEGEVDVRMTIEEGRIDRVQIYGDFLGTRGTTAPLERRLRGAQYNPEALQTVLQTIDVASYPGGLSTRRFLNLLYARR